MALQKVFTDRYIDILKTEINVENYIKENFPLDVEGDGFIVGLEGVEQPEDLETKLLSANNEAEEAIILYEAYKSLSPFVAAQEWLWTYLTHVDLMRYVKKRWPKIEVDDRGTPRSVEESKKYIRNHWFRSSNGPLRTTIMELWWAVYISVDESAGEDHKYDLTRVLFQNQGLRNRRLGSSMLGRNREAMKGILKFIKENPECFSRGLENPMIFISRHFNLIGGKKPLSYMKANFFYKELQKYEGHLKSIKDRSDVIGPNVVI